MPTEETTTTPPLADLDGLLRAELDAVQATFGKHGGKAALARFLGVRPSEISRYFTTKEGYGRTPNAKMLAGMREFMRLHDSALPPQPAPRRKKVAANAN